MIDSLIRPLDVTSVWRMVCLSETEQANDTHPSFAVLSFGEPISDDDVMIPTVVRRFPTAEEAEAYRTYRFGADDEFSGVCED